MSSMYWLLGAGIVTIFLVGCGTTRMTDTTRSATEQLLISDAVDQAISEIDFGPLAGKSVFFDPQYLDGTVDRGYVTSSLRQRMLAQGCIMQEDRAKSTYVVEARSGALGTDQYSMLIGIPQTSLPSFIPCVPATIPEMPLVKKTDEKGIAKLAVFAYNRKTGQRLWQSGALEASSSVSDTWVTFLGPFRAGTIVKGTEFEGEELKMPLQSDQNAVGKSAICAAPTTVAAAWPEPGPTPKCIDEPPWIVTILHAVLDLAVLNRLADAFKPRRSDKCPVFGSEAASKSTSSPPEPSCNLIHS